MKAIYKQIWLIIWRQKGFLIAVYIGIFTELDKIILQSYKFHISSISIARPSNFNNHNYTT
jgi:hypothetical protein